MKFYLLKDHPESTSFVRIIFHQQSIRGADITTATIYTEDEYKLACTHADEFNLYLYEVNATLTLIPKENATSK